jgi:hypothetical protein
MRVTSDSVLLLDGDNFFFDPLFCSPVACGAASTEGDYTVAANSRCLPQNNSCGVGIGAFGQGCASTAIEPMTWGRIKGKYRAE